MIPDSPPQAGCFHILRGVCRADAGGETDTKSAACAFKSHSPESI